MTSYARDRCLSVVMPCFNEESTVGEMVSRVLRSACTLELIVVDDGSTDRTLEVLRRLQDPRLRVLELGINRGKGAALRRGFAETRGPFVIVQDADLEYNPIDYDTLLEPLLDDKADVVYGSRFNAARPHRVLYFWHAVGNRFLTTASNAFTNLNLSDMETCYKAFRREVLDRLELEEAGFGVEPEITAKVAFWGWRIYEVGISYAGRTYAEGKKITWKDGIHALLCILKYSKAGLRLRRGAVTGRLLQGVVSGPMQPTTNGKVPAHSRTAAPPEGARVGVGRPRLSPSASTQSSRASSGAAR